MLGNRKAFVEARVRDRMAPVLVFLHCLLWYIHQLVFSHHLVLWDLSDCHRLQGKSQSHTRISLLVVNAKDYTICSAFLSYFGFPPNRPCHGDLDAWDSSEKGSGKLGPRERGS